MKHTTSRLALAPALAVLVCSLPSLANADTVGAKSDAPSVFFGADLAMGSPVGEFDRYVDTSFGFSAHVGVPIASILSLRIEGAHFIYGSDTWRTANPSFPGVSFEMNTNNTMSYLGTGPQLTGRLGPVRPYVHASLGVAYLATATSLRGNGNEERLAEDTNFHDVTLAYGAGGGLAIPLPGTGWTLSVGSFYQAGGRAEYVLKGGLRNNGDGTVSPQKVESTTGLLRFHVGVSAGL